jgi:hypothetical protein
MARGIFQKINGIWKRVIAPSFKDAGVWKPVQKGFVKRDGVWKQFYPSDVVAKILVVGGGGGGGVGYGYEGGGGGGAGGVVFKENQTLSVLSGNNYTIKVGTGGGANESGTYSQFGTGGIVTTNTSDIPIYAGTLPEYIAFLNTYGVWTNPDFESPVTGGGYVSTTVNYTTNIQVGQTYTVRVSADNHIRLLINGNQVVGNDSSQETNDSVVTLAAGPVTITCYGYNTGGRALFAAALYDPQGRVVWDTRAPINYPVVITGEGGITALGGGNGGWGTTEQTAGSGGSGGGGCGYVYTKGGGAGYPGQGYEGGTGIWQGEGGGGGGGGGKIICTKLYELGLMSKEIYLADQAFGAELLQARPDIYNGYRAWAEIVVDWMDGAGPMMMPWMSNEAFGQAAKAWSTRWAVDIATPWAEEMAYQMGKSPLPNYTGKAIMAVGTPICKLVGVWQRIFGPSKKPAGFVKGAMLIPVFVLLKLVAELGRLIEGKKP